MNKLVFKLFGNPWLAFVLFMLLPGCITGMSTSQIPKESAKPPEIYFCPKADCSKVMEASINSASTYVHCALYSIDLRNVINALARKSKSIDVKVVIDSSNYREQIKGNALRMDDDEQLMHNKFCVIDGNIVLTGSQNPTDRDSNYNNNNLLVVNSAFLAKNYHDEFEELWSGKFGKGKRVEYPVIYLNDLKIENYFCPEDDCASQIVRLIKGAKKSVYFMTFSFTSDEIADALASRSSLEIKGIFDSQQASNKFSQYERLKGLGFDVKKDSNKYSMHHKVFIIDGRIVATGSFNPTLSGDTKNDENLIILHDPKIAAAFLEEFDSLWN